MSARASAWRRSPRATVHVGSALGTFVDSDSVREKKAEINPSVEAWDAVVQGCTGVAPALVGAWNAWRDGWRHFYAEEEHFWTANEEYDSAIAKAGELDKWRDLLAPMCNVPTPPSVLARPNSGGISGPGPLLDASTKWLLGGAIGLGLLVLLRR